MAMAPASLALTRNDPDGATASTTVDPDDPHFRGHYPGFPVLPGVCLIDLVDQTMRAWCATERVELLIIERCRFLGPVFPGDRVTMDLTVTGAGPDLRCAAVASTARGPAARIWLRYRRMAPR
jgi:3-hydroxyacyl-[acyl-carrier-protein] dehydratase